MSGCLRTPVDDELPLGLSLKIFAAAAMERSYNPTRSATGKVTHFFRPTQHADYQSGCLVLIRKITECCIAQGPYVGDVRKVTLTAPVYNVSHE
jgi:hypothetical protein